MSVVIPSTDSRNSSPLCDPEYLRSLPNLPQVDAPQWMRSLIIWSCALTIVLGVITLMSPMDEYVIAPGEVRPAEYAYVFSRAAGLLESVEVVDGQKVSRGQVLARVDGWEIHKQITQIDGEIGQAEAELAMASATSRKVAAAPVPPEFLFSGVEVEGQKEIQSLQQDYMTRLQELQKTGAASGVEMMNLRLQLITSESLLKRSQQANDLFKGEFGAAAQAEATQREHMIQAHLASLRANRALAEEDLKRLEIVSPEDGVILATSRRFPGEKIEAGATLFKVTDAEKTELRLYAGEDRVNRIQPGQFVRFRANNNPDRLAPLASGRVTQVARDRDLESNPAAGDNGHPGTYRVTVSIENEPYPLAVGATVEAEIVLQRRPFWQLLLLKPPAGKPAT